MENQQERHKARKGNLVFLGFIALSWTCILISVQTTPYQIKGTFQIQSASYRVVKTAISSGQFPSHLKVSKEAQRAAKTMPTENWSIRRTGIPDDLNDNDPQEAKATVTVVSSGKSAKFLLTFQLVNNDYKLTHVDFVEDVR